jgi:hypothetical protein
MTSDLKLAIAIVLGVSALSGELGRIDQAGTADSLTMGSSLTGAMVSRLM